jgi:hypothetical protein
MLTFDLSDDATASAPAPASSRFAGIEKRMKERNDRKAQSGSAVSKFQSDFAALQRGVTAQLHVDGGAALDRAVLQEQADDALATLQRMRELLAAQGSSLPAFDAGKASAAIAECEAAVKHFKATHLPKKAFGFRAAVVAPSIPAAPPAAAAAAAAEATVAVFDGGGTTLIENRTSCAIVLLQADVGNDVTLKGLTDCRVWIDAKVSALRCDSLVGCRVMCGQVTGSMWIKRSSACVFVGAAQQVRIAESRDSLFQIRTRSRIGVEASDGLRFAALCAIDGCDSARFDDAQQDQDVWQQVQDFDWIKPTTPSPHWSTAADDDAAVLKRVCASDFSSP